MERKSNVRYSEANRRKLKWPCDMDQKKNISIIQISTCNMAHEFHANGQKGEPAWGDFLDAHASIQHYEGADSDGELEH